MRAVTGGRRAQRSVSEQKGVLSHPCDATDDDQVAFIAGVIVERFSAIDRLVNAAGLALGPHRGPSVPRLPAGVARWLSATK